MSCLLAAAPRRFQVGSLVPSSSCLLPSSRASSSPEAISRPGFPCLLPLRAAPASDLSCQALPRSRRPFVPRSRLWMLEFLRSSLAACFARGLLERSSFFVHAPAVSSCFARGLLERSSFFVHASAVSSFFARGLLECSSCFARGLLARSSCFARAPAVSLVDLPVRFDGLLCSSRWVAIALFPCSSRRRGRARGLRYIVDAHGSYATFPSLHQLPIYRMWQSLARSSTRGILARLHGADSLLGLPASARRRRSARWSALFLPGCLLPGYFPPLPWFAAHPLLLPLAATCRSLSLSPFVEFSIFFRSSV